MYREIEFDEKQNGWGFFVTNPATGSRALVGIFKTAAEAHREAVYRRYCLLSVLRPRVVRWTKANYEKYDYVFKK